MKYPRIALFALAFVASSLVAGTVYGWPPLRALLLRERGELSEKRLARHFTAGSWSVQGGRFVAGVSRDRVGTRFTCCACLAFVVGGALAGAATKFVGETLTLCGNAQASLAPVLRGNEESGLEKAPKDFSIFRAESEMTNGRGAMVGLVALLIAEKFTGGAALF